MTLDLEHLKRLEADATKRPWQRYDTRNGNSLLMAEWPKGDNILSDNGQSSVDTQLLKILTGDSQSTLQCEKCWERG